MRRALSQRQADLRRTLPEETRRLASVLESLPSYDREATPLPEGGAGLYHERFAQMRGHWEDWRKKKPKGKRHYALCANEQGAGVRFTMQGGFKELPRVREMCILQCQAVAQWENKPSRCHTLFENGAFTSTAAQRAMQLDVVPASPEVRDAFIGATGESASRRSSSASMPTGAWRGPVAANTQTVLWRGGRSMRRRS